MNKPRTTTKRRTCRGSRRWWRRSSDLVSSWSEFPPASRSQPRQMPADAGPSSTAIEISPCNIERLQVITVIIKPPPQKRGFTRWTAMFFCLSVCSFVRQSPKTRVEHWQDSGCYPGLHIRGCKQEPRGGAHHSLANRHSCSTPAETQDRKCFSMQLILVQRYSGQQGWYDQSDLPDVIILLKVIVILFCWKNDY